MSKKVLIIAVITLIIDQVLKVVMETWLSLNSSFVVIKDFFSFTVVNNYGAAWSILENQTFILIGAGIVILLLVNRFMNTFKENKRNIIAFGLLFGGIAGNLLDRLFLGYVRDFLSFKIFNYNFPIFNISDTAIFIGVVLLIIAIFKGEDNGNNSQRKLQKN